MSDYNIRVQLQDKGGFKRYFNVTALIVSLEPDTNIRHISTKDQSITVTGYVTHELDNETVKSIPSKSFRFVASDKLADPNTGKTEPDMILDTDVNSFTYNTLIPDPGFYSTIDASGVEEFVLLAETPTTGGTLWQDVSSLIERYILLVEGYGRFD